MLDVLMSFGDHRVDYFESCLGVNPLAFGFYIRGDKSELDVYSREAKYQLYAGLVLIHAKLEIKNLVGIYVDVNSLENLQRPAYRQLKQDLYSGFFRRLFVLDESALFGEAVADEDIFEIQREVAGFEILVCRDGECVPLELDPAR